MTEKPSSNRLIAGTWHPPRAEKPSLAEILRARGDEETADLVEALEESTELMDYWVDQFPRFDVEKPHPFLEQLHKNRAALRAVEKRLGHE